MSTIETTDVEQRIAARIDAKATSLMKIESARTGGVAFSDMGQVMEFAKAMAVASLGVRKHLRGNVGACLSITVQAIEWGMSPFAVASKSYVVNDQIAYEAQLINAVILRRAPISGRFKISYSGVGDSRVCTVALTMLDGTPDATYESPPFGKIHPKNSPLWKTDPDQQQFYYSSRALCRRHFPDVLLGVYSIDELDDDEGASLSDRQRRISDRVEARRATMSIEHSDTPDVDFDTASSRTSDGGTAAAGEGASLEMGAGQPANEREGEPAPGPNTASGGKPSDVSRDEPGDGRGAGGAAEGPSIAPAIGPAVGDARASHEGAAPRQGPQTGVGAASMASTSATSQSVASAPAPGAPRQEGAGLASGSRAGSAPTGREPTADEARKARIAEIKRDGDTRAQSGREALRAFLDQLFADGEDDLITGVKKSEWHGVAKAADAAKGTPK